MEINGNQWKSISSPIRGQLITKKSTAMRFVKGAPVSLLLSLKPKHSAIGLVLSLVVRF
jgi:hypothetical protein